MSTNDDPITTALDALEANNDLANQLDTLKKNLEDRGWSSPAAEQASITMTHLILSSAMVPRGLFG